MTTETPAGPAGTLARALSASVLLLLATVAPVHAQLSPGVWPMAGHDTRHSGRSPISGPTTPADVKVWSGVDKIKMSPIIGQDGILDVGLGFNFCAIDPYPAVTERWCARLRADVSASTAAMDSQGIVYVGDRDNSLTAFDPSKCKTATFTANRNTPITTLEQNGCIKFRYNNGTEGDVDTSPAIDGDGVIYFANTASRDGVGVVTALNPNGTVKWKYVLGVAASTSSPAIDARGRVYIGDTAGYVHAFKYVGGGPSCSSAPAPACGGVVRKWKTRLATSKITGNPVISPDSNTLYIGAATCGEAATCSSVAAPAGLKAVALDPASTAPPPGTVKWTFATAGIVDQTPALSKDGSTLYFGSILSTDKTIYAVDAATAAQKWKMGPVRFDSPYSAFPILGSDGDLYVGFNRGMYKLRASSGAIVSGWPVNTTNVIISYPVIGTSGSNAVVYLGSQDWKVYAMAGPPAGANDPPPPPLPVAHASVDDQTADVNQVLNFSGSGSTGTAPLLYSWDFGDGTPPTAFSSMSAATHAYTAQNSYTARLTVKDGLGFTDGDEVSVTVRVPGSLFDDFTREDCGMSPLPDCTTITPPCDTCPGWAEVPNSDFVISSGQLINVSTGRNIAIRPTVVGSTQTVEADFTSVNNNPSPRLGVVLRFQNANNYYVLYRIVGGTSGIRIAKVVGGVETILAQKTSGQPTVNVPFHLKGTITGQSPATLTLTLGPPQAPTATLSFTEPTAAFASGNIGLLLNAGTSTVHYAVDNFDAISGN